MIDGQCFLAVYRLFQLALYQTLRLQSEQKPWQYRFWMNESPVYDCAIYASLAFCTILRCCLDGLRNVTSRNSRWREHIGVCYIDDNNCAGSEPWWLWTEWLNLLAFQFSGHLLRGRKGYQQMHFCGDIWLKTNFNVDRQSSSSPKFSFRFCFKTKHSESGQPFLIPRN